MRLRSLKRPLVALALALAATAALAGCGGHGDAGISSDAEFNGADVTFAQSMIPHHEQAVVMAELAAVRAASPEVKELAEEIQAAQGPEIEVMTGWLAAWGQDDADSSGHGMGGMSGHTMDHADMPGMMSDAEMSTLGTASGAAFDQMFLTMMIRHHEGAVEMARTQQQEGKFPEAVALAERIEADQTAEIAVMTKLLATP